MESLFFKVRKTVSVCREKRQLIKGERLRGRDRGARETQPREPQGVNSCDRKEEPVLFLYMTQSIGLRPSRASEGASGQGDDAEGDAAGMRAMVK